MTITDKEDIGYDGENLFSLNVSPQDVAAVAGS